ncbi:hypothetical protein ACVMGC_003693 [Bradyrhizobium barranii subsp. barranii]
MRSLLPNLILEGHSRSVLADYDYIARALVNPIDPNHAPRHPVIANIVASEARERAEVYCFDKHTTDIAWAMMNTRRRIRNVMQGVRLPFRRTFFEYETPPTRTGIFVEGDRNDCLISRIDTLNGMPDEPLLTMTLRHVDFDLLVERDDPVVDRVFYSYPVPGLENTSKLLWPEAMDATINLVAALSTFLSLGGSTVSTSKRITREGRIARKRGNPRAMGAIDSYNLVTLKLPASPHHSSATHYTRGPGVRWHTVAGHWREYAPNERRLLGWMAWIADHERGDARKGIIIKDRNVEAR